MHKLALRTDIKNLALIEVLDQGHPEHQEGPAVVENLQEAAVTQGAVSYTHLTLPTKRIV